VVRVKLTPRVRVILLLLAAYLAVMLVLIVYRFIAVVSGR
jgi:hypothetical protein